MKYVFFFLALLVAVAGCKSKQKLVKSEFIEKQTIDTIQVPAERSTLTGTLSYIPGTGIVFTGIDQKQTPGIETSVSITNTGEEYPSRHRLDYRRKQICGGKRKQRI